MTYDTDQPSEQPPEEAHQAPSDESGEVLQLDVAMILYYNLITKARADLKHILAAQRGGVVSIR